MQTVQVELGQRSYAIEIGNGMAEAFGTRLAQWVKSRFCCVVTDGTIEQCGHAEPLRLSLSNQGFRVEIISIPPGELQKCSASLNHLYDELIGFRADRQTVIVALGGGVIGDLAGYAAATLFRGLPLIMVPTTLLSMVDSSVGGKVGINHEHGKNLIGSFYQPRGVWIDTDYLSTLPEAEFLSGMAEVVKYGMILDAEFFHWLESHAELIKQREPQALGHVIAKSCQLKAFVVKRDELETTGLRAILNYGHTFGHALEKVTGYGALLHGQAVSLGMVCAARLAQRLGWLDAPDVERQIRLLKHFELPVILDSNWNVDDVMQIMLGDKKNQSGELRLVLPRKIGAVESDVNVMENLVRETVIACQGTKAS